MNMTTTFKDITHGTAVEDAGNIRSKGHTVCDILRIEMKFKENNNLEEHTSRSRC
jgi:hypothetical protein